MIFGALLLLATGKWPKDDILGKQVRIEHPDRPQHEPPKRTAEDNPAEILRFFAPGK